MQEKLHTYADNLLTNATAMLAEAFGADVPSVPREMRAPCMRLVRLPALKGYEKTWVWQCYDEKTKVKSLPEDSFIKISTKYYTKIGKLT